MRMKELQPPPSTGGTMFTASPNHLKRPHADTDVMPSLQSPKKLKDGYFVSPFDSRAGSFGTSPLTSMHSQMPVFPMPIRVGTPTSFPGHMPPSKSQDTLLTKMLSGETRDDADRESTHNSNFRPSSREGESQGSPTAGNSTRLGGRSPSQESLCSRNSSSSPLRDRNHMASWTVEDVFDFVRSIDLCAEYADVSQTVID